MELVRQWRVHAFATSTVTVSVVSRLRAPCLEQSQAGDSSGNNIEVVQVKAQDPRLNFLSCPMCEVYVLELFFIFVCSN